TANADGRGARLGDDRRPVLRGSVPRAAVRGRSRSDVDGGVGGGASGDCRGPVASVPGSWVVAAGGRWGRGAGGSESGVGRGDRAVDAGDPHGGGEPVLPGGGVPAGSAAG